MDVTKQHGVYSHASGEKARPVAGSLGPARRKSSFCHPRAPPVQVRTRGKLEMRSAVEAAQVWRFHPNLKMDSSTAAPRRSSISPQQTSFTSGWPRHAADCRGRHTGTEPKEPGTYARVSTPPRRHSCLYVPDHAFGPGSSGDGCAPPTSLSLLTMEATGTETTSEPPHPQSFSGDRKQ